MLTYFVLYATASVAVASLIGLSSPANADVGEGLHPFIFVEGDLVNPVSDTLFLDNVDKSASLRFGTGYSVGGGIGITPSPGWQIGLGVYDRESLGLNHPFLVFAQPIDIFDAVQFKAHSITARLETRIYPGEIWESMRSWTVCDTPGWPTAALFLEGAAGIGWNRIDSAKAFFIPASTGLNVSSHTSTAFTGALGAGVTLGLGAESGLSIDLGYRYDWMGKFASGNQIGGPYPYIPFHENAAANEFYARINLDL